VNSSGGGSMFAWISPAWARICRITSIARYIDGLYNPVRRHLALDFLSPAQFGKHASPLFRSKSGLEKSANERVRRSTV
jgi:hypothetical protein